jgi:hypothetical protein
MQSFLLAYKALSKSITIESFPAAEMAVMNTMSGVQKSKYSNIYF